ncbi:hypothetical protein BY996DRAFT_6607565 [Phakopsora pachyrhizi]|nr:hypothetical protein BY996DRAFT_6607565 [Phakopsora pachyrhizi]
MSLWNAGDSIGQNCTVLVDKDNPDVLRWISALRGCRETLPASRNIPKNVFGLLKALMENFCKAYIKTGLGTCQLQLSLFEQAEEDGLQTQKKKDLGMYQDTKSRIKISNLNNRDWDVGYEELPNRSWIELSKGSKLAGALLGLVKRNLVKRDQGFIKQSIDKLKKIDSRFILKDSEPPEQEQETEDDEKTARNCWWGCCWDRLSAEWDSRQSYRPGQIVSTAITGVLTTTAFARIALIGLGQTVIAIWKRLWRDPIRPEQPKRLSVGQNLEKFQRMADLRTVSEKDCRWIEPTSRHKWMDFSVVRAS